MTRLGPRLGPEDIPILTGEVGAMSDEAAFLRATVLPANYTFTATVNKAASTFDIVIPK